MQFGGDWGALVTGTSRPRIGEAFRLFLRGRHEWRDVAVTAVVDGRPGNWRVRKRFLDGGDPVRPGTVAAAGRSSAAVSPAVNV